MLLEPDVKSIFKRAIDYVRWGASQFNRAGLDYGQGTHHAWNDALALVLHALDLSHDVPESALYANLLPSEQKAIEALFKERIDKRLPAVYLTHKGYFAGFEFYIDERVLIPRSPLAEMIEQQFAPWCDPSSVHTILDVGTGSACIAIACALHMPHVQVDAVDISNDALDVARHNCARYHVQDRVQLLHSNVFSALADKTYDVIISNPPYVPKKDMQDLADEYRHEPALALVAGEEGLQVLESMVNDAKKHLNPGGLLIIEVGQAGEALLKQYPEWNFHDVAFERGQGRVFVVQYQSIPSCE